MKTKLIFFLVPTVLSNISVIQHFAFTSFSKNNFKRENPNNIMLLIINWTVQVIFKYSYPINFFFYYYPKLSPRPNLKIEVNYL